MEQKILGIDLGTNSLGIALRNTDNGGDIINQLDYYSSIIFNSGVGKDTKINPPAIPITQIPNMGHIETAYIPRMLPSIRREP